MKQNEEQKDLDQQVDRTLKELKGLNVYLAIPYSGMEAKSYSIANKISGELINIGAKVFSPISHSHQVSPFVDKNTYQTWLPLDISFIERWADVVLVICPDSIKTMTYPDDLLRKSFGVMTELGSAIICGKSIYRLDYDLDNDKAYEVINKII